MIHQSLILKKDPASVSSSTGQTDSSPTASGTIDDAATAVVFAGLADRNANLFRRIGLPLGDPAAWVRLPSGQNLRIVRDLEMDRVREAANSPGDNSPGDDSPGDDSPQAGDAVPDLVVCPADFQPEGVKFSGDRETALAQAVAGCLAKEGVTRVRGDRSLPLIYAWHIAAEGIAIDYDDELGVLDRRVKSKSEIAALRQAQHVTEQVMLEVCRRIATAEVDPNGYLMHQGEFLTSERVRVFAARVFTDRGFTMSHGAIVAGPPHSADCHHAGTGPLRSGVPIIVDLFPRDELSHYHGDCTRTVVHGQPSDVVKQMHAAVIAAKAAAESKLFPGEWAQSVHQASEASLIAAGYPTSRGSITDEPSIQHGTGHGIGLEIHEPILLDDGGEAMLTGEVFTVEPGLYSRLHGGVRVEDMLVVTENGPENLNELPAGLNWE